MMIKDTLITARTKKRELLIFAFCFLAATILNIVGIILYDSPAKELVSMLHIVLLVSAALYGFIAVLRILYHLVSRLWRRT